MGQMRGDAKRQSIVLDVVLIGIGIGIGLLALNALPGIQNWLDAKLAIALGAAGGYAVALVLKLLR